MSVKPSVEIVFQEVKEQFELLQSNATIVTERAKYMLAFLCPLIVWAFNKYPSYSNWLALALASTAVVVFLYGWMPRLLPRNGVYCKLSPATICQKEEVIQALIEKLEENINNQAKVEDKRMRILTVSGIAIIVILILLFPQFAKEVVRLP